MAGDGLTAPSDGGARLSGTPPSGRSGQGRFALPLRKLGRSVRDTGGADPRATASAGAATEPAQQTKAAGTAERTTKVAVPVPERPRLADGVELAGEMVESAFKSPPWLVSRDGRYIQVSKLLYVV